MKEKLREWSTVPVIVISAREQEGDKIKALDGEADDYLTKPFGAGELLARIRVALRHAAPKDQDQGDAVFVAEELRIDLRVFMNQLRKKIEADSTRPRFLLNEPGIGYRFKPDLD